MRDHRLESLDIDLDEDQIILLGDTNPSRDPLLDPLEFWLGLGFLAIVFVSALGALGGVALAFMSY